MYVAPDWVSYIDDSLLVSNSLKTPGLYTVYMRQQPAMELDAVIEYAQTDSGTWLFRTPNGLWTFDIQQASFRRLNGKNVAPLSWRIPRGSQRVGLQVLATVCVGIMLIRFISSSREQLARICDCGYSLRGNRSGRCPECGVEVSSSGDN